MNSATFAGNSASAAPGLGPVPPPPPPPPGVGQIPSLRINTAETYGSKRPQPPSDPYEPPAAIQNAMMTKDKKPFTYTPGMGGKLDLSQIRSPRMARRVAKNANDEGIEGPPKSALEPKAPVPTGSVNLFVQPQVAVPVFPTTIPSPPTTMNRTPNVQINRVPPTVPERHSSVPEQPRVKIETKMTPVTNSSQPNSPETPTSPTSPTQVTLTKAPTPWLQNKTKSQDELPEWARRSNVNRSQETSPECPSSPPIYIQVQQPQPQPLQQKQQPQQFQNRQSPQQPSRPQNNPQERAVPVRIEDRPSVFSAKQESGHHQFQNTQPHHQSRWYQQPQSQVQSQPVRQDPQQSGGYVIPIMVEGNNRTSNGQPVSSPQPTSYSQPQIRIVPIENQTSKINAQRGPVVSQQPECGPIQSKSFRVLQKITDTDADEVDGDQLRKLQLTEDDKLLMNKFKEQVDGDTYLHQEADPRYRGSAIPSRAFRYLQNMTDSGEVTTAGVPRAVNSAIKKQNRNSKSFEEMQANLPASEQTVPEPKKYTGSAIPSRSFRILQAMTTPEAIATQENWQADFVCQTENNIPGNQQTIFYPPCPPTFWSPDGGWWSYHPMPPCIPTTTPHNQSYTFYNHEDGNTYICYPFLKQNCPPFLQTVSETEKQQFLHPANPLDDCDRRDSFNDNPRPLTNNLDSLNDNLESKTQDETRIIVTPCTDDETDSESEPSKSSKCSEKPTSSSSDDSESFLAYSTGLNPQAQFQKSLSATTISEDMCGQSLSSDKLNSDSDSDDQDEEYKIEPLQTDSRVPSHRLSVIHEDTVTTEWDNDPPDDDTTTVSVSLPLRFKFSVSENNQDVTTVIVGDSTIKSEKIASTESEESEIHVDFTLKRKKQSSPEVDFTLRNDLGKVKEVECDEDIETEFTVGESRTDVIKHIHSKESESNSDESETIRNECSSESRSAVFYESVVSNVVYDLVTSEEISSSTPEHKDSKNDESEDVDGSLCRTKSKNLLSVQNSREETDDEDSGVTSDMSRIISEVDTDSECCASTRKQSKYQRTQTHSRLFRLLANDATPSKDRQEDRASSSARRDHLSLPLQPNASTDDHYCSNYSSGMTSPEYSPGYEPEKSTQDFYYQTWKSPKVETDLNILPSMAHKVLDSQKPHWTYKVNVLCPRIRSSKNVPRDLKTTCAKPLGPSSLSFPRNPVSNSHC